MTGMANTFLRPSTVRSALRAINHAKPLSTTFTRGKATVPDLPCTYLPWRPSLHSHHGDQWLTCVTVDDYAALEPAISGQIMELHHSKHHTTYVNSFNNFSEQAASLSSNSPSDIQQQIALQPLINFHGGGHINHSLFWDNLAPKNQGGGEPPSGKLGEKIKETYGGLEELKKVMNAKLAGIQGSGWAWLVKDKETGAIGVRTYAVSSLALLEGDVWVIVEK